MTADERLAAIRAREQAATEGPWVRWHDQERIPGWDGFIVIGDGAAEGEECNPTAKVYTEDDAAFIGHAREDVPWLLDQLTEARACLARVDAALDTLEGYGGPDTHDAYLQIRRASTATCEKCGGRLPGPTESGWWFCDPCENKANKRHKRIRLT